MASGKIAKHFSRTLRHGFCPSHFFIIVLQIKCDPPDCFWVSMVSGSNHHEPDRTMCITIRHEQPSWTILIKCRSLSPLNIDQWTIYNQHDEPLWSTTFGCFFVEPAGRPGPRATIVRYRWGQRASRRWKFRAALIVPLGNLRRDSLVQLDDIISLSYECNHGWSKLETIIMD